MVSSSAPSQRQLRVGEQIRHALSGPLMRGDLRDPNLEGLSITVTEVRISPDLRNATAFVVALGGQLPQGMAPDDLVDALDHAAPYLRGLIASAVRLRNVPRLNFRIDTSFDEGAKIDRLLASETVARDVASGRSETGEEGRDG
ncbi:MAG: 30S ribosome-binding factor RbfA [Pseudomonadota bacterium]